ncbi:hypothetical protein HQN89_35200 [Paenibacillus frigoriresistens]|nr:hypothetical protein [Paenibacillus frigoriresistens]
MSDFETDSISQDIANATQAAEYIKQEKGINPNYLISDQVFRYPRKVRSRQISMTA